MNTILGIVVVYLNGSIDQAHAFGAYHDKLSCWKAGIETIRQWQPHAGLDPKAQVYIVCRDLTDSKAKADGAPSTQL
jgi:hypothetical protein